MLSARWCSFSIRMKEENEYLKMKISTKLFFANEKSNYALNNMNEER